MARDREVVETIEGRANDGTSPGPMTIRTRVRGDLIDMIDRGQLLPEEAARIQRSRDEVEPTEPGYGSGWRLVDGRLRIMELADYPLKRGDYYRAAEHRLYRVTRVDAPDGVAPRSWVFTCDPRAMTPAEIEGAGTA